MLANEEEGEFRDRIKYLSSTCDRLLDCLHTGGKKEAERWASIRGMYDAHVAELSSTCTELRAENGKLTHRLAQNDIKITSVLNENEYLRWENDQFIIEMDSLRKQLEAENLLTKELQAEIRCLQLNQEQINMLHSNRLHEELISARDEASSREGSLRLRLDDAQRKADINFVELAAKCESLEDSLSEKNNLLSEFTLKIEKLTREGQKLNAEFHAYRRDTDAELDRLYTRETSLEARLAVAIDKLKTSLDADSLATEIAAMEAELGIEKSARVAKDAATIALLQNKLNQLSDPSQMIDDDDYDDDESSIDGEAIKTMLAQKSVQIAELREKLVYAEEEARMEREQRKSADVLLAQMGKDMRMLIKSANGSHVSL
uniref:Protein CASP n=1 Tax=Panagrellus redivivus TaxID=6233 RepID=A0A7E4VNE4_PANRE